MAALGDFFSMTRGLPRHPVLVGALDHHGARASGDSKLLSRQERQNFSEATIRRGNQAFGPDVDIGAATTQHTGQGPIGTHGEYYSDMRRTRKVEIMNTPRDMIGVS